MNSFWLIPTNHFCQLMNKSIFKTISKRLQISDSNIRIRWKISNFLYPMFEKIVHESQHWALPGSIPRSPRWLWWPKRGSSLSFRFRYSVFFLFILFVHEVSVQTERKNYRYSTAKVTNGAQKIAVIFLGYFKIGY